MLRQGEASPPGSKQLPSKPHLAAFSCLLVSALPPEQGCLLAALRQPRASAAHPQASAKAGGDWLLLLLQRRRRLFLVGWLCPSAAGLCMAWGQASSTERADEQPAKPGRGEQLSSFAPSGARALGSQAGRPGRQAGRSSSLELWLRWLILLNTSHLHHKVPAGKGAKPSCAQWLAARAERERARSSR